MLELDSQSWGGPWRLFWHDTLVLGEGMGTWSLGKVAEVQEQAGLGCEWLCACVFLPSPDSLTSCLASASPWPLWETCLPCCVLFRILLIVLSVSSYILESIGKTWSSESSGGDSLLIFSPLLLFDFNKPDVSETPVVDFKDKWYLRVERLFSSIIFWGGIISKWKWFYFLKWF